MANPLFKKGMNKVPGSGRKKGTTNKRKYETVAEHLERFGLHPVAEIVKLIPEIDKKDRIKAWLELLAYCEAKPKAIDVMPQDLINPEDFEEVSTDALLQLIKPPGIA